MNELFEAYKQKLKPPQRTVIATFQEIINDLLQRHISEKECRYSPYTKTISLSVNGPLKSEIFMRKSEILQHLKGRLGEANAPRDIL